MIITLDDASTQTHTLTEVLQLANATILAEKCLSTYIPN